MEVINIPNNTTNLSGDSQKEVNRKTAANFAELAGLVGTPYFVSKLITDFLVNEDPYTISGDSFDPPITSQPSIHKAYQIDGDNLYDVTFLISHFAKNGIYYDVVLTAITDQVLNVKISVI